jgi:hypothetical protein
MISHRLLTHETIIQLIDPIDRDHHLLFYSYLTQRKEKVKFIGQFVDNHLTAVLAYLSGLPFLPFLFTVLTRRKSSSQN